MSAVHRPEGVTEAEDGERPPGGLEPSSIGQNSQQTVDKNSQQTVDKIKTGNEK